MNIDERLIRRSQLMKAIGACEMQDSVDVMVACIEENRVGWPIPIGGPIELEAEFWAEHAAYPELWAYFTAIAERLKAQHMGPRGKLQMAKRALDGLPAEVMRKFAHEILQSCRPEGVASHATQQTA